MVEAVQSDQTASHYISHEVESSRLFFMDFAEEEAFGVVFGGFERCAVDYQIDREDVPWFVLEWVSHGAGKLELGGVEADLEPGSFYVYGPAMPHRIVTSAAQPLRKYFVGFRGADVEPFLEQYEMRPGVISRGAKGEHIRRTFDTLIDRGIRKSALAGPLCAVITRQLLLMCRDDATGPVSTDSVAFGTYLRVRQFIEENFLNFNSLQAVAHACNVDAPYLCRLFARFHDESPYQFLIRLRMGRASELLLQAGSSVKSVAAALGFKDAFHFSRVFKAVNQVPPSRFRQSMHGQWRT